MIEYQLLNTTDFVTTLEKEAIIDFLQNELGEYADSRENTSRAIEYALSKFPHQGGFVQIARVEAEIVGVCVVNRTNFEGYFSENILVYIAVRSHHRRAGIATQLLNQTKVYAKGNITIRLNLESEILGLFKKAGFVDDSHEFTFRR